jgi:hypothetical protein
LPIDPVKSKVRCGTERGNISLRYLIKYALYYNRPFLDPQTHSEKLVRSAAVDWSVRFSSFRVLSKVCLAHGLTPEAYMLSDTTDFKFDRVSFRSNDFIIPDGAPTGDSFCVKLLRLYSHSQRKLVAIKQVN